MSKIKEIVNTTTNDSIYRRARKIYLESKGLIHCAYCPYHKNENFGKKNHYGGFVDEDLKHPSWKLVSKNKNQWMKKDIKKITQRGMYRDYVYLVFKKNK